MTPAILIPLMIFTFVFLIVKMGIDHSKEKAILRYGRPEENSLKMSELSDLLRETVEEANRPLINRLQALENRLDQLDRKTLSQSRLLDDLPEVDESSDEFSAERKRVSTRSRI